MSTPGMAGLTGTVDWRKLSDSWGRVPVRLPDHLPSARGSLAAWCFDTIRTAAEPFRSGLRVRAVPNVRFFTNAGRRPGPGDLLPGPEDRDPRGYASRLRADGAGESWLLTVDDPLVLDAPLWRTMRDLLDGLWQRVGWPVLPVGVQLAVGHGYTRTEGAALPPETAGLMWVLAGGCEVRLWREPSANGSSPPPDPAKPDLVLPGKPGDLLYWPADFRAVEVFDDRCMVLKLSVYGAARPALARVKNLMAVIVEESPDYVERQVPYLPYPAPAGADGIVALVEPLDKVGELMHRVVGGSDLPRRLCGQWAMIRSASGLDPVPLPLEVSELEHDDRIRVESTIFRQPDGAGRSVWAVNGRLLPVAGAAADRIRDELTVGTEIGVSELCRLVGAGDHHPAVLELLRKLHRLHAIQPIPNDEGEGAER